MTRIVLALFLVLASVGSLTAQKSIADLLPAHSAAVQDFLAKNKDYQFLSETAMPPAELRYIRRTYGKTFKPYYQTGDLNHDGLRDFAVIFKRKGARIDQGE